MQKKEKRTKLNNKKVVFNGILFDSKVECEYYEYLLRLWKDGTIKDIQLQPKYELIPKFTDFTGKKHRAITYTPDFLVKYNDNRVEAIDIKGFCTNDGNTRKKLFLHRYPEIPLWWISKNKKYGNEDGWINYDELQKIRRINKKEKRT